MAGLGGRDKQYQFSSGRRMRHPGSEIQVQSLPALHRNIEGLTAQPPMPLSRPETNKSLFLTTITSQNEENKSTFVTYDITLVILDIF
jgi:hypothetical protein